MIFVTFSTFGDVTAVGFIRGSSRPAEITKGAEAHWQIWYLRKAAMANRFYGGRGGGIDIGSGQNVAKVRNVAVVTS